MVFNETILQLCPVVDASSGNLLTMSFFSCASKRLGKGWSKLAGRLAVPLREANASVFAGGANVCSVSSDLAHCQTASGAEEAP